MAGSEESDLIEPLKDSNQHSSAIAESKTSIFELASSLESQLKELKNENFKNLKIQLNNQKLVGIDMGKISKNQLRRLKAKKNKQLKLAELIKQLDVPIKPVETEQEQDKDSEPSVAASITSIEIDENDPAFLQFKAVFQRFQDKQEEPSIEEEEKIFYNDEEEDNRGQELISEDEDEDDNGKKDSKKLSKRQQRIRDKIPLAVLKAESQRPELVEWFDADAPDPRFLIYLKNLKNAVPVPSHWTSKREYLSNKRAIERVPFQLPKFIADTGIADMRDTLRDDDDQTLKEKMRHRVQPQMGKLDLDYALLHSAFFKQQTKPKLYGYGDIYYEGKEFQSKFNFENFKPGIISNKLYQALGLPYGSIPPWVPNMKKYGLPPSYPNLRVPGLNADMVEIDSQLDMIDKSHWAALEPDSELEDDDEEEEEEEEEDDEVQYAQHDSDEDKALPVLAIPITEFGSLPGKVLDENKQDLDEVNRPLYQVLEQTNDNRYNIPGTTTETPPPPTTNTLPDDDEEDEKFRF